MNSNRGAAGLALLILVSLWTPRARAIPPDPDNAALLYYQAFLSLAELSDGERKVIRAVAKGEADPNDRAREYIQKCRGAIEFAEAAAQVPTCNWGFRFSQGFDALMPHLSQVRFLTFVLVADVRTRAVDGNYRGALERCLLVDTLARQVGDDTLVSYLVSIAVRDSGHRCMIDVISKASGDASVLRWLKDELATRPAWKLTPVRPLKIEMEIALDAMQVGKLDAFTRIVSEDEQTRAKILAAANEDVLARGRALYSQCITAMLPILGSSLPYEQTHSQLEQLSGGFDPNDPAATFAGLMLPAINRVHTLGARSEAYVNAAAAGVEVCLQKINSGKLPATLPAGLPKDPFSGQDFQYERTDDGFVLRCQGKDLDKDVMEGFQFVVK
ncbi:MAG TPA: hypothetical protein VLI39_08730 [Sedimentisphaerales bacterium]|nr:hypothetical protein [Sedimentisphaerales bacterium]